MRWTISPRRIGTISATGSASSSASTGPRKEVLPRRRPTTRRAAQITPERARSLRHAGARDRQPQQRFRHAGRRRSTRSRSTRPSRPTASTSRLVNACIRAHTQDGPVRPGQLHVAIIGAGATGTELSAELHRTAAPVVAYGLDRIDPEKDIRITLIEAADRILPALPERISVGVLDLLRKLGVDVRTGARVTEVTPDGRPARRRRLRPVRARGLGRRRQGPRRAGTTSTASRPAARTSSSSPRPCRPPATPTSSPSATAPGWCPRPTGRPLPPRAQTAHQQAAHSCASSAAGSPASRCEPFVYRDFGSLVSLGHYSAIGNLMGFLVGKSMFRSRAVRAADVPLALHDAPEGPARRRSRSPSTRSPGR